MLRIDSMWNYLHPMLKDAAGRLSQQTFHLAHVGMVGHLTCTRWIWLRLWELFSCPLLLRVKWSMVGLDSWVIDSVWKIMKNRSAHASTGPDKWITRKGGGLVLMLCRLWYWKDQQRREKFDAKSALGFSPERSRCRRIWELTQVRNHICEERFEIGLFNRQQQESSCNDFFPYVVFYK